MCAVLSTACGSLRETGFWRKDAATLYQNVSGTRFEATVHIQQTAKENNPSLGGLMSGTNRFNYACPHSKVIDPVSSNSLSPVSATSAGQMSCSSSASIHSVIKAMPQWSTEPYVDEMPKHGCLSSIPCFTYHQHA